MKYTAHMLTLHKLKKTVDKKYKMTASQYIQYNAIEAKTAI